LLVSLAALLIAIGTVVAAPPAAAERLVDPLPNPPLPDFCGIDVAIVLDTSGSITSSGGVATPENEFKMKDAAKLVVDTLQGTPSRVGLASFRTLATSELAMTDISTPAGASTVDAAIDAVDFYNPLIQQGTNWEDAFLKTGPLGADVVLFATDGNPTTRNDDVVNDPGFSTEDEDIDAGVAAANTLKQGGTRIVAVGIGNTITVPNLIDISGPTENDDYYLSDFDTLAAALRDVALTLCAPSVTVLKTVDGAPASGWEFTVDHNAAEEPTTAPPDSITDGSGLINYKFTGADPITITLTETAQPGYRFVDVSCAEGDEPFPFEAGDGSATLTIQYPDIVQCQFENHALLGAIQIVKEADVTEAEVGDTITYTYTVTNLGELEVTDLEVVDDLLGPVPLETTTLLPGESTSGTLTYTVTEADLPGPIRNVALGSATVPETGEEVTTSDEETVPVAGLEVVKVADLTEAEVGDTITYTYTVTNTGSVTLTDVAVSDDVLGPITLSSTTIEPGASVTGTATYTVTDSDVPGPIVNVATGSGTTPDGATVTDTDDETVPLTGMPAMTVEKVADTTVAVVGDTITYTYTVTNTGTVTISDLTVEDDILGSITLDTTTLAPGESTTGTATHVVTADDLAGPIDNVATAAGEGPDGTPVTATDDETVPLAAIEVDKDADLEVASPGDTIVYTYTVTNTGSTVLTDIVVTDDLIGPVTLETTTLAPGESTTGFATYVVSDADGVGPVVNVATVSGTTEVVDPDTGEPRTVVAEDEHQVPLLIVLPTTLTTTSQVAAETLPRTGSDTGSMAGLGIALVLLGAALVLALRGSDYPTRS
jgi:uncharacterized repeat protein (TIGR01451 family)